MTLHVFNDGTLFIVGSRPEIIESTVNGTLSIGGVTVPVLSTTPARVPRLQDGTYAVSFEADDGKIYKGGYITVSMFKLVPMAGLTPRECALIHRIDALEEAYTDLSAKYTDLHEKYNNNALNFINE